MRILIAEDDPTAQTIMAKILRQYGECTVVSDGKLALDAFVEAWSKGTPYQLVCLDIMVPNMDGLTALEKLRAFEAQRGVAGSEQAAKVVMTTALEESEYFIKALERGSEWYITKPIDRQKLIAALKDLGLV